MTETRPRQLMDYVQPGGRKPFREWFDQLLKKDPGTASKIATYLTRIQAGNLGNAKLLPGCEGVCELVMDFGPGWRAYFAQVGPVVILLLAGGSKKGQQKDIDLAVAFWREFKQRNRGRI